MLLAAAPALLATAAEDLAPARPVDADPAEASPNGANPTGAQQRQRSSAALVSIRLPLDGSDDERLKGTLQRAVDRLAAEPSDIASRPVLVLEFSADPRSSLPDGRGSSFERSLSLARFLTSDQVAAVKTVAYLPRSVKGHAVLAVLACEEIAMAPDAEIGEAAADEAPDRPIEPFLIGPYREIATTRRTAPPAIAVGWIDRGAEVYRVESEDRIDLVLREAIEPIREQRNIVDEELLVPAGVLGLQTGRQGRELGFVKYLARDRAELARLLRAPAASLEETPLLGEDWQPVVIDLRGAITPRTVRRVSTLIGDEIEKRRVNWIAFRIDSSGGDLESCVRLATVIAELDGGEVRTVAYLPGDATGGAALVALACDQLAMQPGANLGGGYKSRRPNQADNRVAANDKPKNNAAGNNKADDGVVAPNKADADDPRKVRRPLPEGEQQRKQPPRLEAANPEREEVTAAAATIRDALAPASGRSPSLLAAMIDADLRVFRYTHRETGDELLLSQEAAAALPDAGKWRPGAEVTRPGESLRLSADEAATLGVSWRTVDTFDELKQAYGIASQVRVAEPNWALELVQALASRQFAMLLLMVAFIGVYIELNMPGIGFGGFIAAVAFVLFFWSRFTAQTADWLEVMLFVTGVLCILLELLVLPGAGVFGFGGGVLVLASLVLASQTFVIPKTASQLEELRGSIGMVAGALAALMVAGIALRLYLPHTALFRKMQLAPASEADRIELERREAVADYSHLVGAAGVATSNLFPSGKAEINGELIDVIAQGEAIDRGAAVEVVSARATRVMVRAARS